MIPANPLDVVRRLAAEESRCTFFGVVLAELRRRGMDSDDLRDILQSELGEAHCFKVAPTRKYHPATVSDYYSYWVDICETKMFIKLLIDGLGTPDERLIVTSFKKDARFD